MKKPKTELSIVKAMRSCDGGVLTIYLFSYLLSAQLSTSRWNLEKFGGFGDC